MPAFKCSKCGCVDNTALCGYWNRGKSLPLCSACDPNINKWHGAFDRKHATGLKLGNDGFLYSPVNVDNGSLDWKIKHLGFKIVGDA